MKEYGIYSLIFLVGTFSTAFFFFGASSALNRFYFENGGRDYLLNKFGLSNNDIIAATKKII